MILHSFKPALAAALLALACQSAPVAPLPSPLPEALPWPAATDQGVFLGLDCEENSGDSLDALTFDPGVRVVRAIEHSPAAQAGLRPGDVVLSLDGRQVNDPGALDALVQRAGAETEVTLSVLRGDTVFDVPLTLAGSGDGPVAPEPRYRLDPLRSRAGWARDADGVRLVSTAPDGPVPSAGIPVGSVLLSLDGQPLLSARELIRRLDALPAGQRVTLRARLPRGEVVERSVRLYEQPTVLTELGLPILLHYKAAADGSSSSFSLLDLWFFELFSYHRDGEERHWVLLELFGWEIISTSTGVGELTG